jgi:hypothetical protein
MWKYENCEKYGNKKHFSHFRIFDIFIFDFHFSSLTFAADFTRYI